MNCADVGNLIRKLRTDLNMTQKQPADKLGVATRQSQNGREIWAAPT